MNLPLFWANLFFLFDSLELFILLSFLVLCSHKFFAIPLFIVRRTYQTLKFFYTLFFIQPSLSLQHQRLLQSCNPGFFLRNEPLYLRSEHKIFLSKSKDTIFATRFVGEVEVKWSSLKCINLSSLLIFLFIDPIITFLALSIGKLETGDGVEAVYRAF